MAGTPPRRTTDAPVSHPLLVVIVLGFSSLCAALMQSLVIPIQAELPTLLSTSASNASWVVTATLLGGSVAMPVAGRLADIHGKKPVMVVSGVVLLAGSVLCAVSDHFLLVVAGRVLQGMAMGYIPVAISMVREVTPPTMTNTALSAVSATLGVGGALGLPLAAWIVESFHWSVLFWLSAVLAVIVVALSATVLPHRKSEHPARLDRLGAIGLAVGLVGVLVGVTKGNDWGWSHPGTLGAILGGALVLLIWGHYEIRHDDPLVDLRTTARLPVLFTNLAALAMGFGMMAQSIVVPQLLQLPERTGFGLGQSIMQTGLWMAPAGVMMLLFSPVSSALLTRLGGRITLAIGGTVLAAGYIVAVFMMDAPWKLTLAICIASAGVGIGYAAMPSLIMQNVPRDEASSGVGVNTLMRSMGSTTAGAVMAIVLTSRTITPVGGGTAVPSPDAFQTCFVVGAAAALVAVALTLLIPRRPRPLEIPAEPDETAEHTRTMATADA
ncbi:MFS transporter [Myceligenerans pegani]|uniref:MFS transporter n=1 Tax=Myceligenerans pegani TaxID=2776917 RepID=A0ABR9N0G8_9MICO|nr:MFS transporter [Myceligenerans sp. TRM 65318]MBE1876654.1 MFS transporter [Myceligenerans sp. TRM 65318]MBE3018925.1 MFS transporter [Myceligenerans sp. TRM 65318]